MLKRLTDILASMVGIVIFALPVMVLMLVIWRQDRQSPLYISERVGQGGRLFKMIKLRSMISGADKDGFLSHGPDDARITPMGRFMRMTKADELTQFLNVLMGHMSLVGPRPSVPAATAEYTPREEVLLSVKPGMTDIASIVFADQDYIMTHAADPHKAYNTLIRPYKSRFGLLYIEKASWVLDFQLTAITLIALFNRPFALRLLQKVLRGIDCPDDLARVARRAEPLLPSLPPV